MPKHLSDTDAALIIADDGGIRIFIPAHEADELVEQRFIDVMAISQMLADGNPELRGLINSFETSHQSQVPLQ